MFVDFPVIRSGFVKLTEKNR